jgi:hypothetical protein
VRQGVRDLEERVQRGYGVEERAEYDSRRVAAAQARGGDDSGLTGMTMGKGS